MMREDWYEAFEEASQENDRLRTMIRQCREALRCTNTNLYKGMSRSIQRLQAKENTEILAAIEELCGERSESERTTG